MNPTWFSEDFRHICYIQHEAMDGIQPRRGWLGDTLPNMWFRFAPKGQAGYVAVGGYPLVIFYMFKKHGPCVDDVSRFYLLKVKISICYPPVN